MARTINNKIMWEILHKAVYKYNLMNPGNYRSLFQLSTAQLQALLLTEGVEVLITADGNKLVSTNLRDVIANNRRHGIKNPISLFGLNVQKGIKI